MGLLLSELVLDDEMEAFLADGEEKGLNMELLAVAGGCSATSRDFIREDVIEGFQDIAD